MGVAATIASSDLPQDEWPFFGRITDVDAHEMAPGHLWKELYGEASGLIAEVAAPLLNSLGEIHDVWNKEIAGDVSPLTRQNLWFQKGPKAPGAFDFDRRLQAMSGMGIHRQLNFPTLGTIAYSMAIGAGSMLDLCQSDLSRQGLMDLGKAGIDEYNDWCVSITAIDPDRLRPVAFLKPAETADQLLTEARDLIDRGVRAVHVHCGMPLAGHSPAHPDIDPFWAMLSERNIACTLHVGSEFGFLASEEWRRAPAFKPGKVHSTELGHEPWSFATMHFAASNWLTCMVLGGVFERHPALRFGAIELGCSWLGPLADNLDMWSQKVYRERLKPFISRLPSEYLAQNVRVTPFNGIENIEQQLERYPHLIDCYCYSSDYPHQEGGKDSAALMYSRIAHLGPDTVEKFFVTNGQLLLPD